VSYPRVGLEIGWLLDFFVWAIKAELGNLSLKILVTVILLNF
jgi:hypothetical protein